MSERQLALYQRAVRQPQPDRLKSPLSSRTHRPCAAIAATARDQYRYLWQKRPKHKTIPRFTWLIRPRHLAENYPG